MKANELRIGNWVDDKQSGYCQVNMIESGEYNIMPIPLTPEILEKAGFKNNILLLGEGGACSLGWHLIGNTYKGMTTVNLGYDYDDCAYYSYNAERQTELKYVHQLQNLYFALTGEELKIEL